MVLTFSAVSHLTIFETTGPIFQINFAGGIVMLLSVPESLNFKNMVPGYFSKLTTT